MTVSVAEAVGAGRQGQMGEGAIDQVAISAVTGLIVVAISALNSIFRVAVYQYAATGQAPAVFDARLVQTAFGASTRRA